MHTCYTLFLHYTACEVSTHKNKSFGERERERLQQLEVDYSSLHNCETSTI
jgi:hypothetical protein